MKNTESDFKTLRILFWTAPFFAGLYYEGLCAIYSVALLLWLVLYGRKNPITYRRNASTAAVVALLAGYIITPLWAADHGLSLWGIAKILPLALFSVCLMQCSIQQRNTLLRDLPVLGSIMVLTSCILRYIPALTDFFIINGRLGGFFQYPNTFASFLLMGMVVVFFDMQKRLPVRIVEILVLAFGFIQTGSRAAVLIAVPVLLVCALCQKNKKPTALLLGSLALSIAVGILTAKAGNSSATDHLTEMSANASTFLGRLLYWRDALPVCLKHPFGLGYLGYYFMQGSFQSGVYSVRWVHNDLLQILLDVGWIPTVLCVVAAWKAIRCKCHSAMQKMVLVACLAHALCDFDLEYIFMFMIVLLTLDWESGRAVALKTPGVGVGVAVLLTAFSVWVGATSALTVLHQDTAAVRIYPWNTFSQMRLLTEDTDANMLVERSARIIRQNRYSAVAWNAQALVAWQRGDISEMVYAKRKAISCNKYDIAEYTDYIDKLLDGADRYERAGQHENAQLCIEEAKKVPQYLSDTQGETSALAWKIADVPQLELPQEYINKLALLKE